MFSSPVRKDQRSSSARISTCLAILGCTSSVAVASATAPPPIEPRLVDRIEQLADGTGFSISWARRVALDHDRCLVGSACPSNPACTSSAQSAELWEFVGPRGVDGGWQKIAQLVPPGGIASVSEFGSSVALEDDVAIVGAPGTDGGQGVVFVFERDGNGAWSYRQTLAPAAPTPNGRFGNAVALDAERLLVGEPGRIGNGPGGGATLYLRQPDGGFAAETPIVVPTGLPGGGWGTTVGIDGATIVLGSPTTASPGHPTSANVGAVATFQVGRRGLTFEGFVPATESWLAAGSNYATCLAFDDDVLVVHSPNGGPAAFAGWGFVEVFKRSPGQWTYVGPYIGLSVPSGVVRSVATGDGLVAVGTPLNALSHVQLLSVQSTTGGALALFPLRNVSTPATGFTIGTAAAVNGSWWMYRLGETQDLPAQANRLIVQPLGDVAGDCDGDGLPNGAVGSSVPDCDHDLVPDLCGLDDCDGDGLTDACQVALESVESVPTGATVADLFVYYQGPASLLGIFLCRVDVPADASGILQAISYATRIQSPAISQPLYVALYRDGNQDGSPDQLEYIASWSTLAALDGATTLLPLGGGLSLTPGDTYFVALSAPAGTIFTSTAFQVYAGPEVADRTWYSNAPSANPDFELIGETAAFVPFPDSLPHNIRAALLFRTPADANADGTPDVCVCLGDLDGDHAVGPGDLAILLGAWGSPGADLDGDGSTGAADLALLLGAWGSC